MCFEICVEHVKNVNTYSFVRIFIASSLFYQNFSQNDFILLFHLFLQRNNPKSNFSHILRSVNLKNFLKLSHDFLFKIYEGYMNNLLVI